LIGVWIEFATFAHTIDAADPVAFADRGIEQQVIIDLPRCVELVEEAIIRLRKFGIERVLLDLVQCLRRIAEGFEKREVHR